jgi:hypothetical protein
VGLTVGLGLPDGPLGVVALGFGVGFGRFDGLGAGLDVLLGLGLAGGVRLGDGLAALLDVGLADAPAVLLGVALPALAGAGPLVRVVAASSSAPLGITEQTPRTFG